MHFDVRHIIPLMLVLLPYSVFAQDYAVFSGRVLDGSTGESLPGADIVEKSNPAIGVATDMNGDFTLKIDPGQHIFIASFTGMKSDTININIAKGQTINKTIKLKPVPSELQEVVVKAGRFDKRPEESTVSMEVINPKLIESKNTTDIQSILDFTPGLNIINGEPQIRGGSGFTFGVGSKVAVFVDGLPVLSGDAGKPYWELIPVENIGQIEIVKGASSVLSGSSALSGAIYVKTKWPELKPVTKFTVYSGLYTNPKHSYQKWWNEYPYIEGVNFFHSSISNNTDFVLAGNVHFDHGYEGPPDPLPLVVDTVTNFTEKQMAQQRIRLNFSLRHRNQKVDRLNYGLRCNAMYNKSKMVMAWLDDSVGFYRAYPGAVLLQDEVIFYVDPFANYFSKSGYEHSFNSRILYNNNIMTNDQANKNLVIYFDYHFRKKYVTLGNLNFIAGISGQNTSSHAKMYGGSGSPDNKLLNISGYFELEKSFFGRLNINLGMRTEYFAVNSGREELKPILRLGSSLKLGQETYIRMSYGQGYRYPSIAEQFIKLNLGVIGVFDNPNLVPETSTNTEMGIKQGFKLGNFMGYLDVAIYNQVYNNTIEYLFGFWDSTYTFAIAGFKFVNTGRSKINGVDISLNGQLMFNEHSDIKVNMGYSYIIPKSMNPDYVFATDYNPGKPNEYSYRTTSVNPDNNILKYRFLHTLKGDIEFDYKNFSFGLSLKYYSRIVNLDKAIESFEQATKSAGGTLQPIEYMNYFYNHNNGNLIADARLSYEINGKHKISVISNNLTNRMYSLRPLKAEPVRSILLQYTLTI